jgi:transcriptional regulator with XRE-family HTH domain
MTPARAQRLALDRLDRLEEGQRLLRLLLKGSSKQAALAVELRCSETAISAWRQSKRVPRPRMLDRLRLPARARVRFD